MLSCLNLLFVSFVFSFSVSSVSSLACTAQWECTSLAQDANYNFVQCVDSQCVCMPGSNLAVVGGLCSCNAPNTIQWGTPAVGSGAEGTQAFCLPSFAALAAELEEDAACDVYMAKVQKVYELVVTPFALATVTGEISTDDIFDPNMQIRIDPIGAFTGQQGVNEYFFGSAALELVESVAMTRLRCEGNLVSSSVDILFNVSTVPSGIPVYNLTQWGWWTFDPSTQLVTSMDGVILDTVKVDYPVPAQLPAIEQVCYLLTQPSEYSAALGFPDSGICPEIMDPVGYYTSIDDCIDFMSSIEFGSWSRIEANNTLCRLYHSQLAIFSPSVHCVHAGKSGGGFCVYIPFASYYDELY